MNVWKVQIVGIFFDPFLCAHNHPIGLGWGEMLTSMRDFLCPLVRRLVKFLVVGPNSPTPAVRTNEFSLHKAPPIDYYEAVNRRYTVTSISIYVLMFNTLFIWYQLQWRKYRHIEVFWW